MKLKMHKKNENKMGYPNKPEKRGEHQATSKGKRDIYFPYGIWAFKWEGFDSVH